MAAEDRTVNAPVISVILPVRNAANTIGESLGSLLSQTFNAFEVIAVDDGSSDGSDDALRGAAVRDSRVRIVATNGIGLTPAINRGLALASGRYIARHDADDISMPERLERQVHELEARTELCALGTAAITIDAAGRPLGAFPTRHGAATVRAALRTARATPVHGSMMIRRECLEAAGGYREAFVTSQDFDLWLRLLKHGEIDNLNEPLYQWRLSASSVYGARRQTQLMYTGIAMAFDAERLRSGADSYPLLEECAGDLEKFANQYRFAGPLRALWGELLLRGLNDPRLANRQLRLAIRGRDFRPLTLALYGWTSVGLPWIGGKPLGPS